MIIVISWFVWKENNNKDCSDFNFENNERAIPLEKITDDVNYRKGHIITAVEIFLIIELQGGGL